jgi:hypothetical protein
LAGNVAKVELMILVAAATGAHLIADEGVTVIPDLLIGAPKRAKKSASGSASVPAF